MTIEGIEFRRGPSYTCLHCALCGEESTGTAKVLEFPSSPCEVLPCRKPCCKLLAPSPLTTFTEDEILFRDNIRQFAEEKVRPLVKEMDEKGVFEHDLIQQFFQLGLMGIEVPEQYGGAGGKFFEAILAVEEMSRVDASAGVIVDVQNTLVNNALMRWTTEEQRKRYLPRMTADTCGAYALSEAGSGSDAFALQTKAELKGSDYVLNGRKLWITNGKEAGIFILFATDRSGRGLQGHYRVHHREEVSRIHRRQERRQAGHSRFVDLRADSRRLPRAQVERAGRSGQRLQDRD